jgi:hypothetical protein
MLSWRVDVPVTSTVSLPPDPRLLESLGRNHDLETAIADLVDNSVDAGARRVLVRFVLRAAGLVSLYVVDDGKGMKPGDLDAAMTIGGQRNYGKQDLGHFGLGLKAASFSHADSLTVISRARGESPAGRRWLLHKARQDYQCDVVDTEFATEEWDRDWGWRRSTGTLVRWNDVRSFPSSRDPEVTLRYLQNSVDALRLHLGLVFHRFISSNRLTITLDSYDVHYDEAGPPFQVEAIDPFGYVHSPRPDYPKVLETTLNSKPVTLLCHIWPGRSVLREFRLGSTSAERLSGFYIYRHDRLIQIGGWNGAATPDKDLQLARVAVEFHQLASPDVRINPEKFRVDVGPHFVPALEAAKAEDGTTFSDYLDDVRLAFKQSRKRTRARPRVIPPGKGIDPRVRKAMQRELDFIPGEDPIEFRWARLASEQFFEIDRDTRTVRLNAAYRGSVLGDRRGGLNDAPLLKTLLFLLMEDAFKGDYLGARDKDNLAMWTAILGAAARAESD